MNREGKIYSPYKKGGGGENVAENLCFLPHCRVPPKMYFVKCHHFIMRIKDTHCIPHLSPIKPP
jgi:hypothetical protein